MRGVEIGGAAKNVLAIAAGIVQGRRLGASATAALVTRGFAELARFGRAFGARTETLTGLSGLGDLILTCSSPQSRNFSLGIALGEGRTPDGKLAEGAFTAAVLVEMAIEKNIDMPIATAVAAVLDGRLSVDAAIESLLTRPFRAEVSEPCRPPGGGVGSRATKRARALPCVTTLSRSTLPQGEVRGESVAYCCRSPSSSTTCFCSPICCIAKA